MSSRHPILVHALLALGLLSGLALSACDRTDPSAAHAVEGDASARPAAPAFDVQTLDGQRLRLADLKGKVVLVNFWATWCGPCRLEIPELTKLYQTYKEQGFVVVGMSLDSQPEDYVRVEAKRMGADYPVALLGETAGEEWGGIVAIPTSFLIDRHGRIERSLQGYTPIDRLADLIRPLLKEPGA
jgi:thiol-disulfide isomerase/thioredoxin